MTITRPVRSERRFKLEDEMTERREDDSQFDHEKVTLGRAGNRVSQAGTGLGSGRGSDERRARKPREREKREQVNESAKTRKEGKMKKHQKR